MSNWQKTSEGDFHRKSQHLASVGVTPQKPSASTIFVDPAMARRVLAKNTHNRPIKESQVVRLMAEMTSGRWKYNGEAIKWSIDDVLLDGQHRLTALARMDDNFPAIQSFVVHPGECSQPVLPIEEDIIDRPLDGFSVVLPASGSHLGHETHYL
ncbi:hypothetical protein SAMN04488548_10623 [Gordonia westfalica]|uniref:Uncharacterized protein n=1 Tax=Gordonia westfalica TaxID=158898 RepID=A0A1H2DMV2_9ACTN|nr:hypothetical protein SAMN04488548_10623 [Gordonia westfalica]